MTDSRVEDVRVDGTPEYGLLPEAEREHVPGINPTTGEPDSRYDGTITAAAPLTLAAGGLHPTPAPPEHPGWGDELLVVTAPSHASRLVIAHDLVDALAKGAQP